MSDVGDQNLFKDAGYRWLAKFNELTFRERSLVCAGILGVTWAIWFFFIDQHFIDQKMVIAREMKLVKSEIEINQVEKTELLKLAKQDPNQTLNRNIASIRSEIATMKSNLQTSLSHFIPPRAMTLVLQDLLADHSKLTLTKVKRLPAKKLLPDEEVPNLYSHPLQIQMEGEYLDILKYITSLENGDWQFNWESLEYETKGYPNGVATIEIETLSNDKSWLGL